MVRWNAESIRFLTDAAYYTGYYGKLAQAAAPYLAGARHICDAGSGPGFLAEQLAALGFAVTAADRSETAIEAVRARACPGVTGVCCDLRSYTPPERYDAMIFCFFGKMEEILDISGRLCRERTIVLKKAYRQHRFSLTGRLQQDETAEDALRLLERRGIEARHIPICAECGQPFRSLSDAIRFFRLYADGETVTEQAVLSRLQKTENAEFPLYFPQTRQAEMLILDRKEPKT